MSEMLPANEMRCRSCGAVQPMRAVAINGETSDGYHTFNELYEHRHALFCALASEMRDDCWKSLKHDDGSSFDGWFICGIKLHSGMVTYHLPMRLWGEFPGIELTTSPPWDGHTSDDVVQRLKAHANPTDANRAK